jgi:hypothetical protein
LKRAGLAARDYSAASQTGRLLFEILEGKFTEEQLMRAGDTASQPVINGGNTESASTPTGTTK